MKSITTFINESEDLDFSKVESKLEKTYHSASISYDEDSLTVSVSLRTRMAASMGAFMSTSRPIGTHYENIPVEFKGKTPKLGKCTQYKVNYGGSDGDSKEVDPNSVFDPGVDPAAVAKMIIKAGKFTADTLKFVDVRHVSY